jgi:tetratricopeptide (TPR) repeat protein
MTPDPAMPARRPGLDRARPWRIVGRLVILAGLLILTVVQWTHSRAQEAARRPYRLGHYPQVLREALDHLDHRPWSREAARLAALSLSRLDFPDEAEPYYRRAGGLALEDLQVRALAIHRANQRERAIEAYTAILDRRPDDPTALRRLAVLRMTQGDLQGAIRLAERLVDDPDRVEVIRGYTMLGSFHHNLRDHERAVSAYARVLELDPELKDQPLPRRQFWVEYAQDLVNLGQAERGQAIVGRAMREVGEDAELWDLLGQAYYLGGATEDAERAYRRALELDPTSARATVNLGQALLARGEAAEAVACLERVLQRQPNHYAALYNLILANRRLGRMEEAARLQARADDLRRQRGTPTTGMGGPSSSPSP